MDSPSRSSSWYNHASLVCYLDHLGFEILEIRWVDGVCKWRFERSTELAVAIEQFFAEKANVEPLSYFKQVTEFKKEMYDNNPDYVKSEP